MAKDEIKEPVVEAIPAAVSGLVPQSGDEGEFTVKISTASPEEVQAIPAESSGVVTQVCLKFFCDNSADIVKLLHNTRAIGN